MNKLKKGNVLVEPFVILISLITVIMLLVFCINSLKPFALYEKMQYIANKYMYIIEKYGYLTYEETENMIGDFVKEGFNKEKIKIISPNKKQEYGKEIYLEITYEYVQKNLTWNGIINYDSKIIPLKVRKNSISKS